MRPLTASPARTVLPAAHFDRNEKCAYFGDRTPGSGLVEEEVLRMLPWLGLRFIEDLKA
jgi:hypothetical protein